MIYYLYKMVTRLNREINQFDRANLVDRSLQAEHNIMELQLQLHETVQDINIIYRSIRRRAGRHPEEPAA